jgi:iron complex outermembrane receptor protein
MTYSPDRDIPGLFTVSPELYGKTVYTPGFTETELLVNDNNTCGYRLQGSVSYLIKDDLKATFEAKRAQGASTYQNLSRIRCEEIGVNQYRAEVKNKRGFLRAYSTEDFTNKTYDLLALGAALQNAPASEGSPLSYGETFYFVYNEAYKQARNRGLAPDQALAAAQQTANTTQLRTSDPRFAKLRKELIADNQLSRGAGLGFNSFLNDVSGQYSFALREGMELTTGAAYREYRLDKGGRLFEKKANGDRIRNYEYGAYAQLTQQLLDDRLKLAFAARLDEFKNFDPAISPRASAVYTLGANKQHNFRASYGSAFRSPSQLEQYFKSDAGIGILLGNIGNGFQGYVPNLADIGTPGASLSFDRLKLERVTTLEVGYKGLVAPDLYLDLNYYLNYYQDFIGGSLIISNMDGSRPTPAQFAAAADAGFGPGQPTRVIKTFYNNDRTLRTQGVAASLTYYARRELNLTANYTLNVLDDDDLPEGFQTFFNTPRHKYNLGAEGLVGPAFRYSVNYRWVQGHLQETPFTTGRIRNYSTVDAYLGYALPKAFTTLQAGVSNLFNEANVQVYGAPSIGRIAYLGVLLDIK